MNSYEIRKIRLDDKGRLIFPMVVVKKEKLEKRKVVFICRNNPEGGKVAGSLIIHFDKKRPYLFEAPIRQNKTVRRITINKFLRDNLVFLKDEVYLVCSDGQIEIQAINPIA
jgi:DNA-binding transcriptional regulator/RsmH inhibitor MraZ